MRLIALVIWLLLLPAGVSAHRTRMPTESRHRIDDALFTAAASELGLGVTSTEILLRQETAGHPIRRRMAC